MADFGQTARNLTGQLRGRLRIGTIVDPEFTRLGALLKILVESGPGIETELRHGMSGEVPVGLKRNELDVGFFLGDSDDLTGGGEPAFRVRSLARLTYRVVAPPALSPLVRGRDWADLAGLPWIGTPPASVHHRLLARVFDRLGLRQNVVAMVDQEPSMLAMVRTGVGLSLCRESLALDQHQVNGLVIADRVTLETTLAFIALDARRTDPIVTLAFDAIARIWSAID